MVTARICPDVHLAELPKLSPSGRASMWPLNIWATRSPGGRRNAAAILVGIGLSLGSFPASLCLPSNSQADSLRRDATLAEAERRYFGVL